MTRTAIEPFLHPALFYRGAREYLAATVPFVTDGLAAGEPVAVAVPGPNLRLLRAELGTAASQVRLLDMTEVGRNPGRIIPGVLRAFADTHPRRRVRIIGEPIWPQRSQLEYPACAQHEALINLAFGGRPVTILCPYDAAALDPLVLADAARTHPVLIDGTIQRDSDEYAPEAVIAAYNQPLAELPNADVLAVDVTGLPGLRTTVAAFACGLGMCSDQIDDVVLVLTELATNSIEHAHTTATVLIGHDEQHLICQVKDSGYLTDPLAGRRPEVPGQLRGRGLLLVNALSDLVRVHTTPKGTTIEVRFALRGQLGDN